MKIKWKKRNAELSLTTDGDVTIYTHKIWWRLRQLGLYKLFTGVWNGAQINDDTLNREQVVTFTKIHTAVLENSY